LTTINQGTKFSLHRRHGQTEERYLQQRYHPLILIDKSLRTRNGRRQATPPPIIPTNPPEEKQSGVSRVNKEIATLIARKDPVLNRVTKKSKIRLSKQKKERMEVKMVKAAAKAVKIPFPTSG